MTLAPATIHSDKRPLRRLVGPTGRTVVLLCALSLAVRLLVWLPVVAKGTRLAGDEGGYYWRSEGVLQIFDRLIRGQIPDAESLDLLYQGQNPATGGWWPPLQPIAIAIGKRVFGHGIAGGRLFIAILSALTTPFIYFVTTKTFDQKAALAASIIHILYPAFIGFSHFFWAETLYILCLFATLSIIISLPDKDACGRNLLLASGAGLLMGLGVLSRASFLPYLLLFPLWVGMATYGRGRRRRAKFLPILVVCVSLLVLLPWEAMLFSREGEFVLLSTTGTFNFYRLSAGLSASDAMEALEDYAQTHSVSVDTAASILAIEHLKQNPERYAAGVWRNLRINWAGHRIFLRHVFDVYYPPLPQWAPVVLLLFTHISFVLLVAAMCWGLWGKPLFCKASPACQSQLREGLSQAATKPGLLLVAGLVAILMGLPAPGNPRYALPALALFLPFAGRGLAGFKVEHTRRFLLASLGVLILVSCLVINICSLGTLIPSSHYLKAVDALPRYFNSGITTDRVAFRAQDEGLGEIHIRTTDSTYLIEETDARSYEWQVPSDTQELRLRFRGRNAETGLQIEIISPASGGRVVFDPTEPTAWMKWRPAGIDGIEYRWMGR